MIELTLQQNSLAEALGVVTRASNQAMPFEAFKLVKLEASAGRLTLCCFNGEFVASGILPAACQDLAAASVNAATLRDVVQSLDGEITLRFGDSELQLSCGSHKSSLRTSQEKIPTLEAPNTDGCLSLSGKEVRRLAGLVHFASTDDVRPALQTLHLSLKKEEPGQSFLQAQAADGFCLARLRLPVQFSSDSEALPFDETSAPNGFLGLLPATFMRALAAVVQPDDLVWFRPDANGNRAAFRIQGEGREFFLDTALVEGTFPDAAIQELLSKAYADQATECSLQPAEVERVIRQVAAVGTKQVFFKACGGMIRVASDETQYGQAKNVLPGNVVGESAQVWLNADYLNRVIKAAGNELQLKIGIPQAPVLVTSGDLVALIMPLLSNTDPFENEKAIPILMHQVATVPA
jgi:DNA polymerase III sliding clamp (beta) subunit (PCNA family)